MVEARGAVELSPASAKDQQIRCPTAACGLEKQAARVVRPRCSLEPVKHHQVRSPRHPVKSHDIEEVAIVRIPSFGPRGEGWCAAEESSPDRPRMRAGKPPGRGVGAD